MRPKHIAPLQRWVHAVCLFALLVTFSTSMGEAGAFVLVEAHRGDAQNAPENTVASILSAANNGADLSEMDVRLTADGELVLMHDSTVNRTTNGTGSVASLTLAQLQTLDAGSWFSPAFAGEPVPTMADAITAAQGANIQPLIERKAGSAAIYHSQFLSQSLATSDFRVIAFDWGFLGDLDSLNSGYNLGALGSGTINQTVINSVAASGADFLDWNHGSVTQATVDLVHANGMELHAWTVNDPTRMQQLIDFGVDGITTDNPALLSSLLPLTNLVLYVDRETGDIRLENVEQDTLHIQGYSIQSANGAIEPNQWLSITENYDAGNPGPNQVDPNDDWTELATTRWELNEEELVANDGAAITNSSSVLLGSGVWLATPFENDLQMEVMLANGAAQDVTIVFEGNSGQSYAAGDFDVDGDLDAADWLIHNAGRGMDISAMSIAEGYRLGDIDGSGEIDIVDFVLFKERFEAVNGAGSFAAMAGIPEPSAILLAFVGALFFGIVFQWKRRKTAFLFPSTAALVIVVLSFTSELTMATTVNFTNAASGSNADIPLHYGSNIAANSAGFITTDGTGATPNISLTWSPTPNTWEYHTGSFWNTLGTPVHVAQLDGTAPVGDPTILFEANSNVIWALNSLDIGHASDQSEAPFDWDINIVRVSDGATVFSHTTAALGPNGTEAVSVGFTGAPGVDYRLVFDDGGTPNMADTRRAAIDNLSFSEAVFTPFSLSIDRSNGEILLENNSGFDAAIDSYEVTSLSGALDSIEWNSLEDQDFEGNGSPGTGNGWEEAGNINANQLIESYLLGDSLLADGASISLGFAFDFDTFNVQEDILFAYHLAGAPAVSSSGSVSYFGSTENADFNSDGSVDGSDFLVWQNGFGTQSGATQEDGDANSDGAVDGNDFLIWQNNFGSSSSNRATTIPEPQTCWLLAAMVASLLFHKIGLRM